ncbi:helix-turn-helix domain-containing protein [Latilactobacillus curvatus]|nr:helix-turn-helix transcriptional regulator [Latilactobacillus curvatus]MDT3393066.1 helix-turn-helix domain-containing protein [Bacillota bacterium]
MTIGEIVSFYRKYQNLTQSELAEGICTQGTISLIEKGLRIPSVELVTMISTKLGISLDVFESNNFYAPQERYVTMLLNQLESLVNCRDYAKMSPLLTEDILNQYCNNPITKQQFLCYQGIYVNYYEKKPLKALEIYRQALQETNITAFSTIFDLPKHKKQFSKIETLLISGAASCYYLTAHYEKAATLFKIAYRNIDYIDRQLSTQILGTIYYNACKNLKALGEYDEAVELAEKGILFESDRKTIYRSAEIFFELGEISTLQNNLIKAEQYYIRAMYLSFTTNNDHFLRLLLIALKKKLHLPILQENILMFEKSFSTPNELKNATSLSFNVGS